MEYARITRSLIILFTLSIGSTAFCRQPPIAKPPPDDNATWGNRPLYCMVEHNVGNMALTISNHAAFGTGLAISYPRDCFTREPLRSCEYPIGSRTIYLWAGELWIGAIVNGDTLVSTGGSGGSEFHPERKPQGYIKVRSTLDPSKKEFEGAISEQDFIARYADTCHRCSGMGTDARDGRRHRPLNIEITQTSMAWSYAYADDFVLLDYSLKNIGQDRLDKLYMGVYVDADIMHLLEELRGTGHLDDICGFREKQPALYLQPPCPPDSDVVNIAWTADNDGGLSGRNRYPPTLHATATRIIRTPRDSMNVSFNWWAYSRGLSYTYFGPQARNSYREMYGDGYPFGDRDYYHMLTNGEFDYDQVMTAQIDDLDVVWSTPPAQLAGEWATGVDTRYLISFGPFQLEPGRSVPFTLAYVAGSNFHQRAGNFDNLPHDPATWYAGMNFNSLGTNATWAEWVYDNPGVDTDSDGYKGEFTVCNLGDDSTWVCDTLIDSSATPDTAYEWCHWDYDLADTIWRKGDGVPDFRGAMPPAAPTVRVEPSNGKVRVLWNGALSETLPDVFSRGPDFEGYRVYVSRDHRRSSFSAVASYDIENWNRYVWNPSRNDFELVVAPFSLRELRCIYADSCSDTTWHPDSYPRTRPLVFLNPKGEDEVFYFAPQDYNRAILANDPINATSPIKKIYPDAPKPPTIDTDSIRAWYPNGEDTLYLTFDGFLKYYEYEYTIETLLETVMYWINVTAFDYGSPTTGLSAMETNPATNPVTAIAMNRPDFAGSQRPKVFVYPNPYRADVDYRARGFEGRGYEDKSVDRTRQINFANLPPKCTIGIYSIDGDLVREFTHDADPADPAFHMDHWDLITRNSQQPVSGLYYWTVEDEEGNVQIGKLVLIF